MAVNYLGVVHSVKAVLPGMLERGHGRILLVSSSAACIRKLPLSPRFPSRVSRYHLFGYLPDVGSEGHCFLQLSNYSFFKYATR